MGTLRRSLFSDVSWSAPVIAEGPRRRVLCRVTGQACPESKRSALESEVSHFFSQWEPSLSQHVSRYCSRLKFEVLCSDFPISSWETFWRLKRPSVYDVVRHFCWRMRHHPRGVCSWCLLELSWYCCHSGVVQQSLSERCRVMPYFFLQGILAVCTLHVFRTNCRSPRGDLFDRHDRQLDRSAVFD